jgi:hypothetical protein
MPTEQILLVNNEQITGAEVEVQSQQATETATSIPKDPAVELTPCEENLTNKDEKKIVKINQFDEKKVDESTPVNLIAYQYHVKYDQNQLKIVDKALFENNHVESKTYFEKHKAMLKSTIALVDHMIENYFADVKFDHSVMKISAQLHQVDHLISLYQRKETLEKLLSRLRKQYDPKYKTSYKLTQ